MKEQMPEIEWEAPVSIRDIADVVLNWPEADASCRGKAMWEMGEEYSLVTVTDPGLRYSDHAAAYVWMRYPWAFELFVMRLGGTIVEPKYIPEVGHLVRFTGHGDVLEGVVTYVDSDADSFSYTCTGSPSGWGIGVTWSWQIGYCHDLERVME